VKRVRINPLGWHVFSRGSRRLDLFRDDQDRFRFLAILQYSLNTSGCVLVAYVLMANHYHLVLTGDSLQLTACMRRLNRLYSGWHNTKYGFEGHAFDGPYQAFPESTSFMLLRAIAYVFLNPVAAGLADQAADYRWSGYRSFMGSGTSPLAVRPERALSLADRDRSGALEVFRKVMERQRTQEVPKLLTNSRRAIQAMQFEWLLDHAKEFADRLQGEDPALVAAYWGRSFGIATRAMADVLEVSPAGSLSRGIYRFSKKVQSNEALRAALALV
jgi:REP element-mobilizing transposase RayT